MAPQLSRHTAILTGNTSLSTIFFEPLSRNSTTLQYKADEPLPSGALTAILAVSSFMYGISFLALVYAIFHRNYPPLKAKHIPLMSVALVANLLWWIGFMHANGFFVYDGIWKLCALWDIWVQYVFGIMLLCLVLNFRLFSLYQVFVRQQSINNLRFYLTVLSFYIPVIVFGILGLAIPQWTEVYDVGVKQCHMHALYKVGLYGTCLISLLILGWFTFRLRNIRKSFNEFKESRFGFYMALFTVVTNCAIVLSDFSYTFAGKIILSIVNLISGNFYFWMVMYRPLYGCLFHPEKTLREFIVNLDLDGVVRAASITSSRCYSDSIVTVDDNSNDDDQAKLASNARRRKQSTHNKGHVWVSKGDRRATAMIISSYKDSRKHGYQGYVSDNDDDEASNQTERKNTHSDMSPDHYSQPMKQMYPYNQFTRSDSIAKPPFLGSKISSSSQEGDLSAGTVGQVQKKSIVPISSVAQLEDPEPKTPSYMRHGSSNATSKSSGDSSVGLMLPPATRDDSLLSVADYDYAYRPPFPPLRQFSSPSPIPPPAPPSSTAVSITSGFSTSSPQTRTAFEDSDSSDNDNDNVFVAQEYDVTERSVDHTEVVPALQQAQVYHHGATVVEQPLPRRVYHARRTNMDPSFQQHW